MTNFVWKNAASGDWDSASNWSPSGTPGSADTVTIAATGNYTVTIDHADAAQTVKLNAAGATLSLTGTASTLTLGASLLVSAGTLAMTANSVLNESPTITGGTLTTASTGALTINATPGDTESDAAQISSYAVLHGATSIAGGASLELGGGGTITGAVTGAGELLVSDASFSSAATLAANLAVFASTLSDIGISANGIFAPTGPSAQLATSLELFNTGTLALGTNFTLTEAKALVVGLGVFELSNDNVISGPGTLATTGSASVAYPGNTNDELLLGQGLTWNNSGTLDISGRIALNTVSGDHVAIINAAHGTLIMDGKFADIIDHLTDGTDTLTNLGLLQRLPESSSDTGTCSIATVVNSTGIIDVEAGSLALTDGGSISGSLSGAGTLLLYAGDFSIGSLAGNGNLEIGAGASVTFTNSPVISGSTTLDGGNTFAIAADTTITLAGPFQIGDSSGAGTIQGPGTLVTSNATTIADVGIAPLFLDGGLTWINTGTVTAAGLAYIDAHSGTNNTIINKGIFNFSTDAGQLVQYGGGAGTPAFTNQGTLEKTGGAGVSVLGATLTSTGLINAASGTLMALDGGAIGGTLSGAGTLGLGDAAFTTQGIAGGGTLSVMSYDSAASLTGTASGTISAFTWLQGGATLAASAGVTLTLGSTVYLASSLNSSSGTFSGAGTIATAQATGITDLGGSMALFITGGVTWLNTGTVYDSGFTYVDANSGTNQSIVNKGTFNFSNDHAQIVRYGGGAGNPVFTNLGTLVQQAPSGLCQLDATVISTGVIDAISGTLMMTDGGAIGGTLFGGSGTIGLGNGAFTTGGITNGANSEGNLAVTGYGGAASLTGTASGTLRANMTLDGNATLAANSAVTLGIAGNLGIGNAANSTAGTLLGPGTISTAQTTTIADLGGSESLFITGGVTWLNTGTVHDAGFAYVDANSGTNQAIVNSGTFVFSSPDAQIVRYGGGAGNPVFSNTGTLVEQSGGLSQLDATVTSTGLIDAISGTLMMTDGGAIGGTLTGSGVVGLGNGAFTTGGITTGSNTAGTLAVTGYGGAASLTGTASGTIKASVTLDGSATLAANSGVTLAIAGNLGIGNAANSTAGTLAGPGTISTAQSTTINDLGGSESLFLTGGLTWLNTGAVIDNGFVYLDANSGTNQTIKNSGSFTFGNDDAQLEQYGGGAGTPAFINTGTLAKTGGTGTSVLAAKITDTGVINAASGTLMLTQGGSIGGTLSGAGTLGLGGGAFTTTGLAGGGSLLVTNGGGGPATLTATASGTITASVALNQSAVLATAGKAVTLKLAGGLALGDGATAGELSGPGTIVAAGASSIGGDSIGSNAELLLNGVTFANTGTVTANGTLFFDGTSNTASAFLLNSGVFDLAGDTAGFANYGGGGHQLVTNSGTIAKTGGTGVSTLAIAIANSGVLRASTGTLAIAAALTGNGTLAADAGATLELTLGGALTEATSGAGTLLLGGSSAYTDAGAASQAIGTVAVSSNATLTGKGSFSGALADAGQVTASGGTLAFGGLYGNGNVGIAGGATLDITGGGTFTGTISGAGTLLLDGATPLVLQDPGKNPASLSPAAVVIDAGARLDLLTPRPLSGTITGAGTLQLDGGTFSIASGISVAVGTVLVDAGAAISGAGTFTGTLVDNGTVTASGGTLTLAGSTGTGALVAAAGAVLDVTAGASLSETISGAGTLQLDSGAYTVAAKTLAIASIVLDAGASLTGSGSVTGTFVDKGTVIASVGTLTLASVTGTGALQAVSGATLDLTGGGALTEAISGAGTLQLDSGAYTLGGGTLAIGAVALGAAAGLSGTGTIAGALSNAGMVQASGGTLLVKGAVSGAGALQAVAGSVLDLAAASTLGEAISGAGTLQLDSAFALSTSAALSIGTVLVDAGASMSGAGSLSGAVAVNGALNATTGTLAVGGALSGVGTLTAATGDAIDLRGGGVFAGKVTGAGSLLVDGSSAVTLNAASASITKIVVGSGATLEGTGTLGSVINNAGTLAAVGGRLLLTHTLSGSGVFSASAGATLALSAGGALAAVSGAGVLELSGAAFTLGAKPPSVSSIRIDANASLSGSGKLASAIADFGSLSVASGTLVLLGGVTGGGGLSAGANAVLDIAKASSVSGTVSGAGELLVGAGLTLGAGAALAVSSVLQTANIALAAGESVTNGASASYTISAAAAKSVLLSGASGDTFTNAGVLAANGAGTASVNLAFLNSSLVTANSGTLSFLGTLTNNGTIDASAGFVSVSGAVAGTGALEIGGTGSLSLLAGAGSGQTVDFLAGTGLLDLTKPLNFAGTISGFGGGDQIDLLHTASTGFTYANNVLTVVNGTKTVAALSFTGTSNAFSLTSDMHGGTLITFATS